jgi:hypothetical protein
MQHTQHTAALATGKRASGIDLYAAMLLTLDMGKHESDSTCSDCVQGVQGGREAVLRV